MVEDHPVSRRSVLKRGTTATILGTTLTGVAGVVSADDCDAGACLEDEVTGGETDDASDVITIRIYKPSDVPSKNLSNAQFSARLYLASLLAESDRVDGYELKSYSISGSGPGERQLDDADALVDKYGHDGGGNLWLGTDGPGPWSIENHPICDSYPNPGENYPHAWKNAPSLTDFEPVYGFDFRWSIVHEIHHLVNSNMLDNIHNMATIEYSWNGAPYATAGNIPGHEDLEKNPCAVDNADVALYHSAQIGSCAVESINAAIDEFKRKYQ